MPLVNGDMCPIAIDKVAAKAQDKQPKQEKEAPELEDDEKEYMLDHPAIDKAEHFDVPALEQFGQDDE